MKLYNTLSRAYDELNVKNNTVKIYVCGVTVYDDSHIGHARTILIFDVLHRYLKSKGYNVDFVQNFTDVDDKIIKKAKDIGISPKEVSEKYIQKYFDDFSRLNLLPDITYPKATEHIKEMIDLITFLIEKGYAYVTLNGVYFQVKKFPVYGKLSKKSGEALEAGARIEIDPTKKDPLDFALWKFFKEQPTWESPWGKGRPGWHIECSAMALKLLGKTVDIHGGGNDLIFPHHENEIAQSEATTKADFAKIWMHCGMVNINSEKMSKSLGNIVSIGNAIERWGSNTIRVLCLSTQYSKPLDYSEANLLEALAKWRLIENSYYELKFPIEKDKGKEGQDQHTDQDRVSEARKLSNMTIHSTENYLDNNLNTSKALGEFMKYVSDINNSASKETITSKVSDVILPVFNQIMYIFGLKIFEPSDDDVKKIDEMISQRNRFRSEKDFKNADDIRKKLKEEFNVELVDHKDNRTIWKKIEK
ncbi:MAG: cysteine--tRNA ligase [Nitrososphaeraceae archaeon]